MDRASIDLLFNWAGGHERLHTLHNNKTTDPCVGCLRAHWLAAAVFGLRCTSCAGIGRRTLRGPIHSQPRGSVSAAGIVHVSSLFWLSVSTHEKQEETKCLCTLEGRARGCIYDRSKLHRVWVTEPFGYTYEFTEETFNSCVPSSPSCYKERKGKVERWKKRYSRFFYTLPKGSPLKRKRCLQVWSKRRRDDHRLLELKTSTDQWRHFQTVSLWRHSDLSHLLFRGIKALSIQVKSRVMSV